MSTTSASTKVVSRSTDEVSATPRTGELQQVSAAYRLNGKNYLKWSQLIKTILKGKGKLNHILETSPKEGDPNFFSLDKRDSMIMAGLWELYVTEDQ